MSAFYPSQLGSDVSKMADLLRSTMPVQYVTKTTTTTYRPQRIGGTSPIYVSVAMARRFDPPPAYVFKLDR